MLVVEDYSGTPLTGHHSFSGRFVPEASWCSSTRVLKNNALPMIPVLLVSEPLMEVLAATPCLLASLILQCWVEPWCTQAANLVDAAGARLIVPCFTAAVSLVSLELKGTGQAEGEDCGTSGAPTTPGAQSKLLNEFVFVSHVTTLSVLAAGNQEAEHEDTVWGFLVPPERGAGFLARFIKLAMQRSGRAEIFLGSVNPKDLDLHFDMVRMQVQNSSRNTEKRILSAVFGGIDLHMFKAACLDFRLNRFARVQAQLDMIVTDVEACRLSSGVGHVLNVRSRLARRVHSRREELLLCRGREARCSCQSLSEMLQRQMHREVTIVFTMEDANGMAVDANILNVVLTKGLLRDAWCAEVFLGMPERRRRSLHRYLISASLCFDFSNPEFCTDIKQHGLQGAGSRLVADHSPSEAAHHHHHQHLHHDP